MRFGIGEATHYTLKEIGVHLAVDRRGIRNIESSAMRKLRHRARRAQLEAFVGSGAEPV